MNDAKWVTRKICGTTNQILIFFETIISIVLIIWAKGKKFEGKMAKVFQIWQNYGLSKGHIL